MGKISRPKRVRIYVKHALNAEDKQNLTVYTLMNVRPKIYFQHTAGKICFLLLKMI